MKKTEPELQLKPGERPSLEEPKEHRQLSVSNGEPSVAGMLQSVIEKGITSENVAALESLVGLYERLQSKDAERAFNKAFVKVQSVIPEIKADKNVPDGKGGVLYSYCSFEEIYRQLKPLLSANGFSVRFTQKQADGRITETCYLMHDSGHTVSSEFTARIGQGARGMNETKCDLSASTIAQREAFCDVLNIPRIGRDDDAANIGAPIDPAKAAELRQRVRELGKDEVKFLKFCGVTASYPVDPEDYCNIKDSNLDEIERRLSEAEAKGKS